MVEGPNLSERFQLDPLSLPSLSCQQQVGLVSDLSKPSAPLPSPTCLSHSSCSARDFPGWGCSWKTPSKDTKNRRGRVVTSKGGGGEGRAHRRTLHPCLALPVLPHGEILRENVSCSCSRQ